MGGGIVWLIFTGSFIVFIMSLQETAGVAVPVNGGGGAGQGTFCSCMLQVTAIPPKSGSIEAHCTAPAIASLACGSGGGTGGLGGGLHQFSVVGLAGFEKFGVAGAE